VEFEDQFFIVFLQDDRRPYGMEEHEDYGNKAGEAMEGELNRSTGDESHHRGAERIERKPAPEHPEVPPFEPVLQLLRPYPDGIEYAGKVDEDKGMNEEDVFHFSVFASSR